VICVSHAYFQLSRYLQRHATVLRINEWPVGDRLFGAPSKSAPGASAPLAPPKASTEYAYIFGSSKPDQTDLASLLSRHEVIMALSSIEILVPLQISLGKHLINNVMRAKQLPSRLYRYYVWEEYFYYNLMCLI
jgi:hypothetical protein